MQIPLTPQEQSGTFRTKREGGQHAGYSRATAAPGSLSRPGARPGFAMAGSIGETLPSIWVGVPRRWHSGRCRVEARRRTRTRSAAGSSTTWTTWTPAKRAAARTRPMSAKLHRPCMGRPKFLRCLAAGRPPIGPPDDHGIPLADIPRAHTCSRPAWPEIKTARPLGKAAWPGHRCRSTNGGKSDACRIIHEIVRQTVLGQPARPKERRAGARDRRRINPASDRK
jgi:hypothetical protein